MKVEWKKCPSVTKGGKPFFWVTTNLEEKYWVVWDRFTKTWVVSIRPKTKEEDPYKDWFSSPKSAMKYVEKLNEGGD